MRPATIMAVAALLAMPSSYKLKFTRLVIISVGCEPKARIQ
jgi:hypothetical protein